MNTMNLWVFGCVCASALSVVVGGDFKDSWNVSVCFAFFVGGSSALELSSSMLTPSSSCDSAV